MSGIAPTPSAQAARADVRHASAAALEAALLDEFGRLRERLRGDPRALSAPARVLVSNRLAREHWLGVLCARHGSLVGLRVQTLWSAALEVLAAGGHAAPRIDEALFDALVSDAAAAEPALRAELGSYENAYGLAAASASDLLSAGLRSLDSLAPALAQLGAPWAERVRALARAALAARARAAAAGCTRRGDVLSAAAAALADGAPFAARPLWIVGLYDATGQLARFVEALRARGARWHLVDVPAPAETANVEIASPPTVAAEWDELAAALRAELARGTPPARIAIAARIDAASAGTARATLELHGVPAAGGEVDGRYDPRCRLALARIALATRGASATLDAWLDAWSPEHALAPWREDLRLALRALGVTRLTEVAALDARECAAGRALLPLPARGRAPDAAEESDDDTEAESPDEARPARRMLAVDVLERALTGARALVETLSAGAEPASAGLPKQLARTLHGVEARLGVPQLEESDLELPAGVELGPDAYRTLLEQRVRARFAAPLFEGRSGVRFARPEQLSGLHLECLFAPGLDRGAFPRAGREDPLLPDSVRRALAPVLPWLACKSERAAEEARLWRELVGCASRVRLSCARVGSDGAVATRSPYLRALARGPRASAASPLSAPLPARRRLLALAGSGARLDIEALGTLFELARGEGRACTPAAEVARALAALHCEREATFAPRLSAWHGGCTRIAARDRHATFWEGYAGCGWQALLTRELGLEPAPDPLGALPELDARLLGTTVHAALEALYAPGAGAPLASPAPAEVAAAVDRAAAATLREHGVRLAGLARALSALARPFVERALELTRLQGPAELVGCEHEARCELAGLEIRFRADRVDRNGDELRFVDYKTGKSFGVKRLLADVRRGRLLQGVCYAASAPHARGEYWFLHPESSERSARLSTEDLEAGGRPAAEAALAVLRDALEHGLCLPRPAIGARTNPACNRCEVESACSRSDSGWRLRFARHAEPGGSPDPLLERVRAYTALAAIETKKPSAPEESAGA